MHHFIRVSVDMEAVARLQLEVTLPDIVNAIRRSRHIKVEDIVINGEEIDVVPENTAGKDADENDGDDQADYDPTAAGSRRGRRKRHHQSYFQLLQDTLRHVENVVVKGYPDTSRAIIRREDKPDGGAEHELLVEGYGLRACMNTPGVDGLHTSTNSIMEVFSVLGIEAARGVIISEIQSVMKSMDIDVHHVDLLACIMTVKGEVLGITRFGMVKMGDSVLQLASFEKTPDHLFEAATRMKSDPIAGVSESIIMGQTVKLGTGAASVVRPLELRDEDLARKAPVFGAALRSKGRAEGWDDWDLHRVTGMSLHR
jgi:DNA-directed RNA polymerase III subunit RPC1